MSNYYISNCCSAEVKYERENEGVCIACGEPCELEVIEDEETCGSMDRF